MELILYKFKEPRLLNFPIHLNQKNFRVKNYPKTKSISPVLEISDTKTSRKLIRKRKIHSNIHNLNIRQDSESLFDKNNTKSFQVFEGNSLNSKNRKKRN